MGESRDVTRIVAVRASEVLGVSERPTKVCVVCGREIQWRKKWERDWESVKYCSDACRRGTGMARVAELEAAIMTLLTARARGTTICPSEAARAVDRDDWRPLVQPARAAARRLVDRGLIEITQSGRIVDPSTARGAIRLRRR